MVKAWACALMRERGISVWKGYTDKTIAALLGIVHDGESEDDAKRALDIAYIEWQRSKKQYAAARQNPERRSSRVSAYKVDRVDDDAFLRTYEWRRLRMEAIKKYGRRCQCCGATPHDGAKIHVDHIKPRKIFPELALDIKNLQILCHECNHGKGNWDMTDWRKNEAPV
jgi:5-methylcytosine-specific restriction endonuclease McrA